MCIIRPPISFSGLLFLHFSLFLTFLYLAYLCMSCNLLRQGCEGVCVGICGWVCRCVCWCTYVCAMCEWISASVCMRVVGVTVVNRFSHKEFSEYFLGPGLESKSPLIHILYKFFQLITSSRPQRWILLNGLLVRFWKA